jgi:hypothetical protein
MKAQIAERCMCVPRNVARKELDRRIFICTELNPREEARLLLTQLAVIDASRRIRQ